MLRIVPAEERRVQNQLREDAAHAPHVHRLAVGQAVTQLHNTENKPSVNPIVLAITSN